MTRTFAIPLSALLFAVCLLALPTGRHALAQSGGCTLRGAEYDSNTGARIQGVEMVVLETGQTMYTDAGGNWSFQLPGGGYYTVVNYDWRYTTHAQHYVLDGGCHVTSRKVDANLYSYGSGSGSTTYGTLQIENSTGASLTVTVGGQGSWYVADGRTGQIQLPSGQYQMTATNSVCQPLSETVTIRSGWISEHTITCS